MVWSPSGVSGATSVTSSSGSSCSLPTSSSRRGGSHASTRRLPSHPLAKTRSRNTPPTLEVALHLAVPSGQTARDRRRSPTTGRRYRCRSDPPCADDALVVGRLAGCRGGRLLGCSPLVMGGSPSACCPVGLSRWGGRAPGLSRWSCLRDPDRPGPGRSTAPLNVVGLAPAEVGGKVLLGGGRRLPPPRPVGECLVKRHAPDLDDQEGLVAVSGQRGLSDLVERLCALSFAVGRLCLPGRHHQPPRSARRSPPPAFAVPARRVDRRELAAGTEVAFHLGRSTGRVGRAG